MLTKEQIKELLNELYAADPGLREHEDMLLKTVEQLIKNRPDVKIDERFMAALRTELVQKISKTPAKTEKKSFSFFRMPVLIPAGAAIVVIIAAVVVSKQIPGWFYTNAGPDTVKNGNSGAKIIAMGEHAFGSLGNVGSASEASNAAAKDSTQNSATGGGANTLSVPAAAPVAGFGRGGGSGTTGDAGKMMAPVESMPIRPQMYKYVYKGEEIKDLSAQGEVLKRVKGSAQNSSFSFPQNSVLGLIDISKFSNLNLQSFTLAQDVDSGYVISVDMNAGLVSINQNYERWPHPERNCTNDACWQQYQLKAQDVPADADLIAIANRFLDEYGISRSDYGEPVVQNTWRNVAYAKSIGVTEAYVPDSITIMYPLLVDDKKSYDDGGNVYGLNVTVNIRNKKVDNVWNLTTNQYQSSNYSTETDSSRLIKVAEQGGVYGGVYYDNANAEVIEVGLGTPTLVYEKTWIFNNNGTNDELLVPALMFPVQKPDNVPYIQSNIMVPLVKEILDRSVNNNPSPILLKGAPTATAEPGAAASTPAAPPERKE